MPAPDVQSLPYLLLDIRTPDEFEQCHIIGGMLGKATPWDRNLMCMSFLTCHPLFFIPSGDQSVPFRVCVDDMFC